MNHTSTDYCGNYDRQVGLLTRICITEKTYYKKPGGPDVKNLVVLTY